MVIAHPRGYVYPVLTVAIPTLNRPSATVDAVSDVLDQLPAGGELLVLDQSDAAVHAGLAAALDVLGDERLRVLHLSVRGLPNARNVAIALATQPILLFLDDDVRLAAGCLLAHTRAYGDPGVGGVGGRIHERVVKPNSPVLANRITRSGRVLTRLDTPHWGELETLKGAHMSFRTALLRQTGGFDRRYTGTAFLEDADGSTRVRALGKRLVYCPAASLTHLSEPAGGVRVGSVEGTEESRFHNTGLYVGTHRPVRHWPLVAATFAAIAARRAGEWGDPGTAARLMSALWSGFRASQSAPDHGAAR